MILKRKKIILLVLVIVLLVFVGRAFYKVYEVQNYTPEQLIEKNK